jgi:hypothetical protein
MSLRTSLEQFTRSGDGRARATRAGSEGHGDGRRRGLSRRTLALVVAAVALLVSAGPALGLLLLPPGGRVNNDPPSGINSTFSVGGEDPANSDVTGGALVAGKPAVPWAVFRQQETNAAPPPHDQIF